MDVKLSVDIPDVVGTAWPGSTVLVIPLYFGHELFNAKGPSFWPRENSWIYAMTHLRQLFSHHNGFTFDSRRWPICVLRRLRFDVFVLTAFLLVRVRREPL